MYEVVTINSIKVEEVVRDLDLPSDHVKAYFGNYEIYKKYPIRDLTFYEEQLVKAIKDVKLMDDNTLKRVLDENGITVDELRNDQLLIERRMAKYFDERAYALTRKYQHFILEPAVLYGNKEAPITRALDMENVVVLLSNIALGLVNQTSETDTKTRITALSKIADIYTTNKLLTLNNGDVITSEDLTELSPKDLARMISQLKAPKNLDDIKEVEIVKTEKLKEFILFD